MRKKIEVGQIYWLITESEIAHPYVIIEIISNEKVKVCGITTNMKKLNLPGNVLLEIGEGNLEKRSIIDVSKYVEIYNKQLGEYIGVLNTSRIKEIHTGIKFLDRTYFSK